jgi:hypothetical protein
MTASIYTDDEWILWGVVANAGRRSDSELPRWVHVKHATGVGSTKATELCWRFGFDPDEETGGGRMTRESSHE